MQLGTQKYPSFIVACTLLLFDPCQAEKIYKYINKIKNAMSSDIENKKNIKTM